jgi:hypothetical protein
MSDITTTLASSLAIMGIYFLVRAVNRKETEIHELKADIEELDRDRCECVEARWREEEQNIALVAASVFPDRRSPTQFRYSIGPHEGLAFSREDAERAVRAIAAGANGGAGGEVGDGKGGQGQ